MSTIIINNIEKKFENGPKVLNGINLKVESGSFTVILGPSGAGKSTLLRLINGLIMPTKGEIFVDNLKVTKQNLREIRGNVGMVFQQFNLVNRLSVMTNVLVGRLKERSWVKSVLYLFKKEDLSFAYECLKRVGLENKCWDRTDKLSGGQQQRVGIARSLAQNPKVILADEPVASLDPVTTEEIMHLLKEICLQDKITLLVSLHQVELAKRYADRIIGINSGAVVFDGSPEDLDNKILQKIYKREGVYNDKHLESALAYA